MPFTPEELQEMGISSADKPAGESTGAPAPEELEQSRGEHKLVAIGESPLTMGERAMLGWVRGPEQLRYLKSKYPDADVVDNGQGGASLVIKDKDNKWYQADPAMHWTGDDSLTGKVLGSAVGNVLGGGFGSAIGGVAGLTKGSVKDAAGTGWQFMGEYGLRAEAAMAAGSATLAATSPMWAAGPVGAIGSAGLSLGAAAGAAAGAEALDLGGRKLAQTSIADFPGAEPYHDADEVQKQLIASAWFGAEQFGLGKTFESATKAVSSVAETYARGGSEGVQSTKRLWGLMGANEGLVESRLMNPKRTQQYDDMLIRDANKAIDAPKEIDAAEDAGFNRVHKEMQGALQREQGAFGNFEKSANVQNLKQDTAPVVNKAVSDLQSPSRGFIDENGQIIQDREYGDGDKQALDLVRKLRGKPPQTYYEIRQAVTDIGNRFDAGVTSRPIRGVLDELKTSLNRSIIEGLGESDGRMYGSLIDRYAGVRSVMNDLNGLTEAPGKKLRFVEKLIDPTKRTVQQGLITDLRKAGIDMDSVHNLLQIQAARDSRFLFTQPKLLKGQGFSVNPDAVAKKFINKSGNGPAAQKMLPYTDKALKAMRGLGPYQLKEVLMKPEYLEQILQGVAGAATAEKEHTDSLVGQAQQGGGQ